MPGIGNLVKYLGLERLIEKTLCIRRDMTLSLNDAAYGYIFNTAWYPADQRTEWKTRE